MPDTEWDDEQQGWMLALAALEASRCGGCGGDLAETLTTEASDWEPLPPWQCAKCERLAIQQEANAKDHKYPHTFRWAARRKR